MKVKRTLIRRILEHEHVREHSVEEPDPGALDNLEPILRDCLKTPRTPQPIAGVWHVSAWMDVIDLWARLWPDARTEEPSLTILRVGPGPLRRDELSTLFGKRKEGWTRPFYLEVSREASTELLQREGEFLPFRIFESADLECAFAWTWAKRIWKESDLEVIGAEHL